MRRYFALILLAAGLVLAGTLAAQDDGDGQTDLPIPEEVVETLRERLVERDTVYVAGSDAAQELSRAFSSIVRSVGPTVVTINSSRTITRTIPGFPSPFDPWGLRRRPRTEEFETRGLGSGVIFDEDGIVVTNNHVVENADEIEVVLSGGDSYPAELVGTDPETDVAVLRIDADTLTAAEFGDSDALDVGEWVLAIGSPFALSQTVTQGIVSYMGRTDLGLADYESYIQTSAAINPGNSGGALVNMRGELVGINTAIASRSGGSQGVGFAIPINTVERVVEDLLEHGAVRRGWLGVMIQEVTPELAGQFDAPEGTVLISQVLEDSPAEDGDLQRGDIVLELDDEQVDGISRFRNSIAEMEPGTEVDLLIRRDGEEMELDVELGARPGDKVSVASGGTGSVEAGWRLSALEADQLDRLGIRSGVAVSGVERGGAAARAGVRPGDVILEVNRESVESPADVRQQLQPEAENLLLVLRDGNTLYLVLQL
jgi:serine protease Do